MDLEDINMISGLCKGFAEERKKWAARILEAINGEIDAKKEAENAKCDSEYWRKKTADSDYWRERATKAEEELREQEDNGKPVGECQESFGFAECLQQDLNAARETAKLLQYKLDANVSIIHQLRNDLGEARETVQRQAVMLNSANNDSVITDLTPHIEAISRYEVAEEELAVSQELCELRAADLSALLELIRQCHAGQMSLSRILVLENGWEVLPDEQSGSGFAGPGSNTGRQDDPGSGSGCGCGCGCDGVCGQLASEEFGCDGAACCVPVPSDHASRNGGYSQVSGVLTNTFCDGRIETQSFGPCCPSPNGVRVRSKSNDGIPEHG